MQDFEVVVNEEYKGINIVIVKMCWNYLGIYHNGYIKCAKSNTVLRSAFECYAEMTFDEDLTHVDKKLKSNYIGFDTLHYYNTIHPDTQTEKAVLHKLKLIVDEYLKDIKKAK